MTWSTGAGAAIRLRWARDEDVKVQCGRRDDRCGTQWETGETATDSPAAHRVLRVRREIARTIARHEWANIAMEVVHWREGGAHSHVRREPPTEAEGASAESGICPVLSWSAELCSPCGVLVTATVVSTRRRIPGSRSPRAFAGTYWRFQASHICVLKSLTHSFCLGFISFPPTTRWVLLQFPTVRLGTLTPPARAM